MELSFRLLDHPFYQAWNEGRVSEAQLARYAAGYLSFISEMPVYWKRIADGLGARSEEADAVISDEEAHIALWEKWAMKLPAPNDYPEPSAAKDAFASMSPSELLGAVHAFEIQQPEVARTKRAGLLKHYGFVKDDLAYFDEHEDEARHIALGQRLASTAASRDEFQRGFERGQKIIYDTLDLFV